MNDKEAIERLEVMKDCYMMFFDNSSGGRSEAKYEENKQAFEYAVNAIRILSKIPKEAVLIDRGDLWQAVIHHTYSVNVTEDVNQAITEVLSLIDEADIYFGGEENGT